MWLDLTSLGDCGAAEVSTATNIEATVSAPPSTFTYCYSVSDSGSDAGKSMTDDEQPNEQPNEQSENPKDISPRGAPSEAWSPVSLEACSPISGRKCSAPDPANVPKPLNLRLGFAAAVARHREREALEQAAQ